jgi:hypothetical protein
MAKRIKVHAVARKEPDVRLYVLALIELARQLQAEEREAADRANATVTRGEVDL